MIVCEDCFNFSKGAILNVNHRVVQNLYFFCQKIKKTQALERASKKSTLKFKKIYIIYKYHMIKNKKC